MLLERQVISSISKDHSAFIFRDYA